MKRLLLSLVLAAGLLSAEPVYLSAHGKTYHKTEHCMSLARAHHVYTADRSAAEAHGLHACSICYRAKAASKSKSAPSWASEAPRTAKQETEAQQ